ncbi:MAG: glycosyltransferase family 2 protein [Syntrophothermus sp.]|uniref:glycosyltransferase family 2 protein n=1 Tax=Syntrophothermus sp. TaxID=2736299 RepID=UPI00257AF351|nr:glycosyltransferase family 2 protein [Syntrophothermus sp.]NSW84032.1 glycosyltransferase family 2 protein [Syntrophothermus sp.]
MAVIVLNWNGWRDTIECLESLQRSTYPNYQIIVVDNGSTDNSVKHIQSAHPDITIIENGRNLGYAGGNNAGIQYALEQGVEFVLILNNDVKVEPKTVRAMVEVAKESGASIVGALVKDIRDGKVLFARSLYPWMFFFSEPQRYAFDKRWWPSDRVEGSAMLLNRDLLLERWRVLGYFLDESLFLYCEELELAMWCRHFRKKSVVAGEAVVHHKVAASSGGKGKPSRFYYLTRNRLLLARRYLQGPIRIIFQVCYPVWRIIRAGMYLGRWQPEIAGAILQGLIDGYRGKIGAEL